MKVGKLKLIGDDASLESTEAAPEQSGGLFLSRQTKCHNPKTLRSSRHNTPQGYSGAALGFTIVEVLVAIAVAAVVTMSLNAVVTTYVHTAQRGRYLNLANSYVEGKVEALRNIGYSGLASGTSSLTSELPTQLPPSRSASLTVSSPANGLKQVDITVSYKDQGQTNSYTYTTYIGELGVGQ